ncbi:FecR family protein [Flavobacteriaceae bacterium F08102]|nr:FecR family protein [Flavobacteriaceae bacterium F08102]
MLKDLIYKLLSETISEAEEEQLYVLLQKPKNKKIFEAYIREAYTVNELYTHVDSEKAYDKIWTRIEKESPKVIPFYKRSVFKYAAAIIILVVTANTLYKKSPYYETKITNKAIQEIKPGFEKATLILSDGSVIDLKDQKGKLTTTGADVQIENKENQLVFEPVLNPTDSIVNEEVTYNTLSVPTGGIYSVKLPDGTMVWLNSSTTLKFPELFLGEQRIVELEGEAYFEVAKNGKEFIVKTEMADITVLGTQFNVSSYKEDSFFSSTLVEGKIKLSTTLDSSSNNSVFLTPNKRTVIDKNTLKFTTTTVDPEIYTAWKDGKFYFEQESLEQILLKASRWYDIKVEFEDNSLKNEIMTGVEYKNQSIVKLLKLISKTANINYVITKDKEKYLLKLSK